MACDVKASVDWCVDQDLFQIIFNGANCQTVSIFGDKKCRCKLAVQKHGSFTLKVGRNQKRQEDFMSVLIDFSIFPTDKGESVSPYVSRVVKIIRNSGLPNKLGPMSTSVEGGWNEVMVVVSRCFEELKRDCGRVYMTLNADYRKGTSGRIESKVKSIEEKL